MLPTIDRRPRRSMYASDSLPPSTIATRTSCGSALVSMRLTWVIYLSVPRRGTHAEERARREVKVVVRARVRAVQGRSHRCAPRTLEACRGSGHGVEDRHQELTIAGMGGGPLRPAPPEA